MAKEKSEAFKKFEALDETYGKDKRAYETLEADKDTVKKLKLAILDQQSKISSMKTENYRAELMGTQPPHDKAEMDKAAEDLKKALQELEDFKSKVKGSLDKVNSRFAELEKNPEMKKQLDAILATRLERAIKKDQAVIDTYKQLEFIMAKHPNVQATVKGIVNSNRKIASLNAKIERIEKKPESTRTDEEKKELADSKTELAKVQTSLADKKAQMETFLSKQYPDLTKEQKDLIYDLNTSNLSKAIKGKEKDISYRQAAYKKLTGREYEAPAKKEKQEEKQEETKGKKKESTSLAKVSRWQKFKNWVKAAWNGELKKDKEEASEELEPEPVRGKKEREGSEFRSAYKYDIVKDYVEQRESEMIREAKKPRERDSEDKAR